MQYNRYNKKNYSKKDNLSSENNLLNLSEVEEYKKSDNIPIDKNKQIFDFDPIKKFNLYELQKYIKEIDGFKTNNIGSKEIILYELILYFNQKYNVQITGSLDIIAEYGFIRYMENNYLQSKYDLYVSNFNIQNYCLRSCDVITCIIKVCGSKLILQEIVLITGLKPSFAKNRNLFEYLTPHYPKEQIVLETEGDYSNNNYTLRLIDLIAPIGKGQRMLIVSQPKSGKTTLLQQMAIKINELTETTSNTIVIILLIDERPEEVTEMKRVIPNATVISSTFDETPDKHIKVSETVFETAKRYAESGKHVIILMDSLTRLARAYNNSKQNSGKLMSGGLDAECLQKPKQLLGIARNLGDTSVTIIATVLNSTGSKGDDIVYEELKSTGNSELELSRKLAQMDIFPAIELGPSSTRRSDLFLSEDNTRKIKILRNFLLQNYGSSVEAISWLLKIIKESQSNAYLLNNMVKKNK